jgi:hypothetical protein
MNHNQRANVTAAVTQDVFQFSGTENALKSEQNAEAMARKWKR